MTGWKTWVAGVLIGILIAVVAVLLFSNRQLREGQSALQAEADRLADEAVIQANRANKAVFEAERSRASRQKAEAKIEAAKIELDKQRARADQNAKRIAKLPKPKDLHEANAQIVELHQQLEFQEIALAAADDTIAEQRDALLLDEQTIDALADALYHRDREASLYKGAAKKEREHSTLLSKAIRRERARKASLIVGSFLAGLGGGYAMGNFL